MSLDFFRLWPVRNIRAHSCGSRGTARDRASISRPTSIGVLVEAGDHHVDITFDRPRLPRPGLIRSCLPSVQQFGKESEFVGGAKSCQIPNAYSSGGTGSPYS